MRHWSGIFAFIALVLLVIAATSSGGISNTFVALGLTLGCTAIFLSLREVEYKRRLRITEAVGDTVIFYQQIKGIGAERYHVITKTAEYIITLRGLDVILVQEIKEGMRFYEYTRTS